MKPNHTYTGENKTAGELVQKLIKTAEEITKTLKETPLEREIRLSEKKES